MIKRLLQWWKERGCEHLWRPGVLRVCGKYTPVKVCGECNKTVTITLPEFYAQFGRMPW